MKNYISLAWSQLFPFIPIVGYLALCLVTPRRQLQGIPDKKHPVLDSRMTTNLQLVGFSFTVVGLLVTLFQKDLSNVYRSVFLFSLGLACFFSSYILLNLRLRRAFDTFSDGLTNNALWAVIAGLRSLFGAFEHLRSIAILFTILLILLASYIALDLFFKWRDRNRGINDG